jgi:ATP-dependent helicase IRC3
LKPLRPYQQKAITASLDRLSKGANSQLIVSATGTGKSRLAVSLIEQGNFNRTLWITDREELCQQSAMAFIAEKFDESFVNHINEMGFINYIKNGAFFAGKDFKMGLIKADVFEPSGNVVIASAQTLHKRLDKIDPYEFDAVICDEAHVFISQTFSKAVNFLKPKLLLGLTATDYRFDGMPLTNIFEETVFEYGMRDGIRDGYLCGMDAIRIKTNANLDKVHSLGGEFNQKELSNEVNTLARNNIVADKYIEYCNGRQGIFFGVDIQHCIDLEEAFKQRGINAKAVSSKEELTGDRTGDVKLYKEGKIDVLINVGILTTGFDHPNTGVIGCASPTKSKTKYVQIVGRGSRLKDEAFVKRFGQNCIVLDFVDNTNRHNLVNAHELDKELDPEERVFISEEKREKLIAERSRRKIWHEQKEDEKVSLFALPKVKIIKSVRMKEPATPAQLAVLAKWGYDVVNTIYTKAMASSIFGEQPATEKTINWLKWKGYDVEGKFISVAQAMVAGKEIEEREKKKIIKRF